MESVSARQIAVQRIRSRVVPILGQWLNAVECVQVSIACACKEPVPVLGVLLPKDKTALVAAHIQELAIQEEEWSALFGIDSRHGRVQSATSFAQTTAFVQSIEAMESALRCTLAESSPKAAWKRAVTRLATYVAMQFANHEDAVASVLGCVVRADTRRVDELRSIMEERGQDTLAVLEMINALGEAAC